MHVSFLMFCFSAVCFFIYVSFRTVVSAIWAFLSSRHSSGLYWFLPRDDGPVSVCVCPSVSLSQVGVLLKRMNVELHKQHHTIVQGL